MGICPLVIMKRIYLNTALFAHRKPMNKLMMTVYNMFIGTVSEIDNSNIQLLVNKCPIKRIG